MYLGFNNVYIKSSNEWKTAFCINYSIFEFLVISSAIFQTIINNIFQYFIMEDIIIVYLNDILIFIWILDEHYKVVYQVLKVLTKYKLFLHPEKYEFNRPCIKYLDLVILENQAEVSHSLSTEMSSNRIWRKGAFEGY